MKLKTYDTNKITCSRCGEQESKEILESLGMCLVCDKQILRNMEVAYSELLQEEHNAPNWVYEGE